MSSSLVRLAALRMQLGELERTPCARCGHTLQRHLPLRFADGVPCREWHWLYGDDGMITKDVHCKCKEFADSLDEQLSLDPPKATK